MCRGLLILGVFLQVSSFDPLLIKDIIKHGSITVDMLENVPLKRKQRGNHKPVGFSSKIKFGGGSSVFGVRAHVSILS